MSTPLTSYGTNQQQTLSTKAPSDAVNVSGRQAASTAAAVAGPPANQWVYPVIRAGNGGGTDDDDWPVYDPYTGLRTAAVLGGCMLLVLVYILYKTRCGGRLGRSRRRWTSKDRLFVEKYKRKVKERYTSRGSGGGVNRRGAVASLADAVHSNHVDPHKRHMVAAATAAVAPAASQPAAVATGLVEQNGELTPAMAAKRNQLHADGNETANNSSPKTAVVLVLEPASTAAAGGRLTTPFNVKVSGGSGVPSSVHGTAVDVGHRSSSSGPVASAIESDKLNRTQRVAADSPSIVPNSSSSNTYVGPTVHIRSVSSRIGASGHSSSTTGADVGRTVPPSAANAGMHGVAISAAPPNATALATVAHDINRRPLVLSPASRLVPSAAPAAVVSANCDQTTLQLDDCQASEQRQRWTTDPVKVDKATPSSHDAVDGQTVASARAVANVLSSNTAATLTPDASSCLTLQRKPAAAAAASLPEVEMQLQCCLSMTDVSRVTSLSGDRTKCAVGKPLGDAFVGVDDKLYTERTNADMDQFQEATTRV